MTTLWFSIRFYKYVSTVKYNAFISIAAIDKKLNKIKDQSNILENRVLGFPGKREDKTNE